MCVRRYPAVHARQLLLRVGKAEFETPCHLRVAPVRGYLISIERREVVLDDRRQLLENANFLSYFNNLRSRRPFGRGAAFMQRITHGARMIRTAAA